MADDEQGFSLTADSIESLRADHEFIAGLVMSERGRRLITRPSSGGGGSSGVVIGRALTAIAPASSNLVGSAFTFVKFIVDDGDATPKLLKEELDGEEPKATDGVNRSTKRSASVDAFVTLEKNNGEWVLLTVDEVCAE